ncbi:DUF2452 domain-containing protein [Phaeocystidibacter luteus]|uniref:DUF2452 domain-containing protein n=1 Tax=Phaeocystidibacter luteus TaxID=911197 RepID=A0A6N6RLI1_9FLAO|nr:DUF2452 domain-containing protein [Phaeocystidibacter luteus]KAB2814420.1 DUF2452 domain-containing protein [Phaeocystidibacter luteus]
MSEKDINPIDPDKITENPSTLPYAHTVGGAKITVPDLNRNRSRALEAMDHQTDQQLDQIREQIELLAEQAKKIQQRKELSEIIYAAQMGFKPEINHIYHLYLKEDQSYVLSMIGPDEWPGGMKYESFVYTLRLLADHTWDIVETSN